MSVAPSTRPELPVEVGDVLAGKYRVERLLGAGGMGVVVAARHLDLNELRAVKFLLPQAKRDHDAVERFMREARAVVKLKNPHVVRVHDIGRLAGGEPYLVMEYLEGVDLRQRLRAERRLSLPDSLDITLQTLEAMAEAHATNVVHRDLKPANIFLTHDVDGSLSVKVLDFGISKLLDGDDEQMEMTTTNTLMGSPYYMSPEQMMSARDVDARTDIWSIGVVLFQMLTGRVPFRGKNIATQCALLLQNDAPAPSSCLDAPLPRGLDEAILGFLRRDPKERHESAAAAAAALAPFAANGGAAALSRIQRVSRLSGDGVPPPNLALASTSVADDDDPTSKSDRRVLAHAPERAAPLPALLSGEASPAEAMSQSTKASWQAIDAPRPRARRIGVAFAALLAIGVGMGGAVVAFYEPTPANESPGAAPTQPTPPNATSLEPPTTATTPREQARPPSTPGDASADEPLVPPPPSASAESAEADAPRPVKRSPTARPAPKRPVAPPSAEDDPFGDSRK